VKRENMVVEETQSAREEEEASREAKEKRHTTTKTENLTPQRTISSCR